MESSKEKTDTDDDECKGDSETKETASLPEEQSSEVTTLPEQSSSSAGSAMLTGNEEMVSQLTDGFLSEVQPQLLELREKTKEIT